MRAFHYRATRKRRLRSSLWQLYRSMAGKAAAGALPKCLKNSVEKGRAEHSRGAAPLCAQHAPRGSGAAQQWRRHFVYRKNALLYTYLRRRLRLRASTKGAGYRGSINAATPHWATRSLAGRTRHSV